MTNHNYYNHHNHLTKHSHSSSHNSSNGFPPGFVFTPPYSSPPAVVDPHPSTTFPSSTTLPASAPQIHQSSTIRPLTPLTPRPPPRPRCKPLAVVPRKLQIRTPPPPEPITTRVEALMKYQQLFIDEQHTLLNAQHATLQKLLQRIDNDALVIGTKNDTIARLREKLELHVCTPTMPSGRVGDFSNPRAAPSPPFMMAVGSPMPPAPPTLPIKHHRRRKSSSGSATLPSPVSRPRSVQRKSRSSSTTVDPETPVAATRFSGADWVGSEASIPDVHELEFWERNIEEEQEEEERRMMDGFHFGTEQPYTWDNSAMKMRHVR